MSVGKREIEIALVAEKQEISAGRLKEDNPLDDSEGFHLLCQACRRGDLKICQENIQAGVNINARDRFDYTPLILASLCGHFEVVQLLLESGALCERDTFQGERCLYNALNDRIRNLLLAYDYSKSRDPLQPLAGHISSLLYRDTPETYDITLQTDNRSFRLHKFILAARSPFFAKKLAVAPETTTWKVPNSIPARSLEVAIMALYLAEVNLDLSGSDEDQAVLAGIEKLGRQLEIGDLFQTILESDRRLARQKRTEEVERGRDQLDAWFTKTLLGNRIRIASDKADNVKWDSQNSIFADVLLCATDDDTEDSIPASNTAGESSNPSARNTSGPLNGIPIGPLSLPSRASSPSRPSKQATLFPAHRAMLLRSEYFSAMFSSAFIEAQPSQHLPVIHVDCSPAVLTVILTYLYTENSNFNLDVAIDVLFTADQLFIEKLKVKAAMIISTLGNGAASVVESENPRGEMDAEEAVNIYDVIRAGWDTRVHRLEEFGARYIAYRLERFIDEEEFKELVKESAARITKRQETDTVELIDDIRYYLSERFRLRFEDTGFDDLIEEAKGQAQDDVPFPEWRPETSISEQNFEPAMFGDAPPHKSEERNNQAHAQPPSVPVQPDGNVVIRTLDGEIAGDEFAQDALNYQILLGKIDTLLDELRLDA